MIVEILFFINNFNAILSHIFITYNSLFYMMFKLRIYLYKTASNTCKISKSIEIIKWVSELSLNIIIIFI